MPGYCQEGVKRGYHGATLPKSFRKQKG
jgi:hypothetical protein